MLARCLALATLSAAGCTALPPLRSAFESEHRVQAAPGQSRVEAKAGDVVYLEVGPTVPDPPQQGFRVNVNDRRPERPEWDFPKNGTLCYMLRAKVPGEYRVEVYAPYPNEQPRTLRWTVTVTE